MSDLVKRLRERVRYGDARLLDPNGHDPLCMAAADRIEALEAAQAWRPIETAPRDGTFVLVANERVAWEARMGRRGWYCLRYGFSLQPTHWMPLPQPPGGEHD